MFTSWRTLIHHHTGLHTDVELYSVERTEHIYIDSCSPSCTNTWAVPDKLGKLLEVETSLFSSLHYLFVATPIHLEKVDWELR